MTKPTSFPPQEQEFPGREGNMVPQPEIIRKNYKGSDKLKNKVAIITGGDSGIGRSAAVHFAREGADLAIIYLEEDKDAETTKSLIERENRECMLIKGDISNESFCIDSINQVVNRFKHINILVNNAGMHQPAEKIEDITSSQLEKVFKTNIFSFFYLTKESLKHMSPGDCIINTTSVTAYRGSGHLLDYSSTKGAILSFTRSLSKNLAGKNIRVNAVAPGPIWTPLIASTFDKENIKKFGKSTPLERAGQPSEVGPAFVFLASEDASYITGQAIHPNGGEVVGA